MTAQRFRTPVWLPAAATVVVGFALAEATEVRAAGGAVLVLGGIGCALLARPRTSPARVGGVLAVAVAAVVGSHPLGLVIGTWPAVLAAAALVGTAAYLLVDRCPSSR